MRDTCIQEDQNAEISIEKLYTEQQELNITEQRLEATIATNQAAVAKLQTEIEEIEIMTNQSEAERTEQHLAFKQAVTDINSQQEMLHKAIATLENFYGSAAAAALLQRGGPAAHAGRRGPGSGAA